MRIQTRLFLGTAALVLSLMGLQWWLYSRQLHAIEDDVTRVATTVGTHVLTAERAFFGGACVDDSGVWVNREEARDVEADDKVARGIETNSDVRVMVIPRSSGSYLIEQEGDQLIRRESVSPIDESGSEQIEWVIENRELESSDDAELEAQPRLEDGEQQPPGNIRKLVVEVERGSARHDRFLVVSEDNHAVHRIPIPVSPAVHSVQETMREGATMGGLLLIAGLFGSGILSRRLTRPLRSLAEGAEALGQGALGVQVPESATGEVGDLQRSFNRMSGRLAELEEERERWLEREHLAQLGDLSRGLAHTLRNPLHTLGLAVEELASGSKEKGTLVSTSRAQIRRIDRWLRSFLALGAEEAAEPETTDLGILVRAVALESVQQGAEVRVEGGDEDLPVRVVPGAVRAALANLIENATEVSPDGEEVEVTIAVEGPEAVVVIADRGPGLPEAVRERLFSPHVTTKIGGSGMGLFLARQLVVGMNGGKLELADGDTGGTVATIRFPLVSVGSSTEEQAVE